jgi:streptogramin lyase
MKHPLKLIILWLFALPVWGHPGIGIVEDSNGGVFYTDLKQVWRIDPAGNKSVVVRNVHTHELDTNHE